MTMFKFALRAAVAGSIGCIGLPALAQEAPDLTGVWTFYAEPGSSAFGVSPPAALPFTEEGKKRRDEYSKLLGPEQANPGAYCVAYGMPTMMEMAGGYPIEFIQKPDQVTIIFEVEGETRRVYLGKRGVPEDKRLPSRQGYSSGRWEGGTLVVETDTLTDGVDQMAHPHSDQAKFVERFTPGTDAKGTRILSYEMTLTDPIYYTQPVTIKKKWQAMPDGYIMAYNCTEEPWLRLLDARREQLRAGKPVTAKMADVIEVY